MHVFWLPWSTSNDWSLFRNREAEKWLFLYSDINNTPPKTLTSLLLSHSSVLGFKVVQGEAHQGYTKNLTVILSITQFLSRDGCTVRGYRQRATAVVLTCKWEREAKRQQLQLISQKTLMGRCSQQHSVSARKIAQASKHCKSAS